MVLKTDYIALRKAFMDKGLSSISQISNAVGVNHRTISGVLNGKKSTVHIDYGEDSSLFLIPEQARAVFCRKFTYRKKWDCMNNLQIFRNADFGSIRTIEQNGEVLFYGRDIAVALKDALSKQLQL